MDKILPVKDSRVFEIKFAFSKGSLKSLDNHFPKTKTFSVSSFSLSVGLIAIEAEETVVTCSLFFFSLDISSPRCGGR